MDVARRLASRPIWHRNIAVARVLVDLLEDVNPKVPEATFDWKKVVIP